MEKYLERIGSDPKIMLGKPLVKGTRITVETVLRKLSEGASANQVIEMYPHLSLEDVHAVLQYAADVIGNERIMDPAA